MAVNFQAMKISLKHWAARFILPNLIVHGAGGREYQWFAAAFFSLRE